MIDNFLVGDVVKLKSGGPLMTISAPEKDGDKSVECVWFDGNETRYRVFKIEMLIYPHD